jgi:hypothetical protein
MKQATYGRNRQSIADIEEVLHNLIFVHPRSQVNDAGEPVIPGDALVDILTGYSELHNNVELISKDEEVQLVQFLASNPGLEATPKLLVEFIAFRTTSDESPAQAAAAATSSDEGSENDSPEERGRHAERGIYDQHSRSSSTDSVGTSVYSPPSRASSRGPPKTPTSTHDSPFDASKRQRSAPLGNIAPSSWTKRPPPAHRRKSDAGRSSSDSEVYILLFHLCFPATYTVFAVDYGYINTEFVGETKKSFTRPVKSYIPTGGLIFAIHFSIRFFLTRKFPTVPSTLTYSIVS